MLDSKITFNAIDFETATGKRNSACAVAIVKVVGANVVDVWSTLIQPPNNYYSQRNIDVHGILPSATRSAKFFWSVYPEIEKRLRGIPIVAHNAAFDKSVLLAGIDSAKISPHKDLPSKWQCTYKLYRHLRSVKKATYKLKLNVLCDMYGIELNHHDATSDALACAELFINFMRDHVD